MTVEVAENTRKAAKTKYLPRVDALAGYQHFSREISLLSDDQKNTFSNLGTNTFGQLGGQIGQNFNLVSTTRYSQSTGSSAAWSALK